MSSSAVTSHMPAPSVTSAPGGASGGAVTEREASRRTSGLPVVAERPRPARTPVDLRAQLATVLAGAFPDARFELYVLDADANLAPLPGPGVARPGSRKLLAALRARVLEAHHDLTDPLVLPALPELRGCTAMSAPLVDDAGAFLGLVVLERGPEKPDFSVADLGVLEGIATLMAPAVQRACPTERSRRRELDLRKACKLQRRLMSGTLPQGVGVTALVEYRPALGVGGDFYSLRYLGGGLVSVAIGDVAGNGISAALVMSRVASDIERALGAGDAPAAVLGRINGELADADSELFVTASCLRVDTVSRTMTAANAGHLPVVVRRASGEVFTCGGASGTPLGIERCDYDDEEIGLEPGDIVLLATDGLLEALDHPSGFRGLERLLDLLREGPHDARAVHDRLCATVDEARRLHDLDDVTWVALQIAA